MRVVGGDVLEGLVGRWCSAVCVRAHQHRRGAHRLAGNDVEESRRPLPGEVN